MRRADRPRSWLLALGLAGCATYQPFDSARHLRATLVDRMGDQALEVLVPFELDAELAAVAERRRTGSASEVRRAAALADFVFGDLRLEYRLRPTRDAAGAYRSRQGNCLSFVNLFVGLARADRLAAFYVEVEDAQSWSHSHGMVVSQGHVVAGLRVDGTLRTYDFLPYRPKPYRSFRPIDDVTAVAHFYNNLAAEALLSDDAERAAELLATAVRVAPGFARAWNNLGVARARRGDEAGAEAAYATGLALAPEEPALLNNLARLHQRAGRLDEASRVLDRLEALRVSNPYFFVYRGQVALAQDEPLRALEYLTEALRQDSELPEVHVALAQTYLAVGDLPRARHHLSRALRLDATHPEALRLATRLPPEAR